MARGFRRVFPVTVLLMALVLPAAPAYADSSAPTLSPAQGPAGTLVTATANDWIGCSSMSVGGWGVTMATTSISSSGGFTLRFRVPAAASGPAQLLFSPSCSHSTWMPVLTFTVTADTTAPTVSWVSPIGNGGSTTVSSGTVTLSATASDDVGVARVKFFRWDAVNGVWADIATLSAPPWQLSLSVTVLNGAWNQLNVQAFDFAGNASASPAILVYRTDTSAPNVSWLSPVGNGGTATVSSGAVTFSVAASDNIAVIRVKFTRWDTITARWVDVVTLTRPPWQATIAVSSFNGAWNQVNVQAWDSVGNASSSPYIWVYRTVPSTTRLSVPFATQMGTAGDPNSGSNNCGPASITMAIRYYTGSTTSPTVQDSAVAIRGYNNINNTPTDFKSQSTINWLARYSLVERSVTTYDQIRGEVSAGRPVVVLVNNNAYRYLNPYPNNNDGWFTPTHIVVVTGYDATNVYINDPLRGTGGFPVPVSAFAQAASTTGSTTSSSWYAASIARS